MAEGDEIFYCSDRRAIDTNLEAYAKGPTGYYLGKIRLQDYSVIGCVSSMSTAYSDDIFHAASLNYDGYPYINKITRIYLAILLLILFITSTFI